MAEARSCNAPMYPELSIEKLYDKILENDGMSDYFPDTYSKGRYCDRTYFWTIWNSLFPELVKQSIEHANA